MTRITGVNFAMRQPLDGGNGGWERLTTPPKSNEPVIKIEEGGKRHTYVTYYDYEESRWRRYKIGDPNSPEYATSFIVAKGLAKYSQDDGIVDMKEASMMQLEVYEMPRVRDIVFPLFYAALTDGDGISQQEQSKIMSNLFRYDYRSEEQK